MAPTPRIRVAAPLCMLTLLLVCGLAAAALVAEELEEAPSAFRPWMDASQPVNTRVAALVAAMNITEKIGQLLYTYLPGGTVEHLLQLFPFGAGSLSAPGVTGNFSAGVIARNQIQEAFVSSSRLGIPLSFYEETMRSAGLTGVTVFPTPACLGTAWNASLLYAIGRVIATEATALGVDRSLSPVLQVATDPRWGRVYENFGEDPLLVATLGGAMTSGLLGPNSTGGPSTYLGDDASLIVTAKHGVAYGLSNSDGYAADLSERALHEIYIKPWRAFAAAGGRGLMVRQK